MHFLVLSDAHADTKYIEKLDDEFKKADAVIFAGDFTNYDEPEKAMPVLKLLEEKSPALYSVLGNCDKPSFLEELEKRDISVQGTMVFRDGLAFAGSGGASKFTGVTPNERTEEELQSDFDMVAEHSAEYEEYPFDESDGEDAAAKAETAEAENAGAKQTADASLEWNSLIVISHNPPKDTKVDMISNGMHVGSALYREFLETYQPLLSVSGHVHEAVGIDTVGKTTVINPGALMEGRYAVVDVQKQNGTWKVTNAVLKQLS
ncbi:MAG: metallophosphoesterase family protein [Spirochaetaceae bacterium]|nr:metallophosphoesterase family protein [Spirochaetaceae bacterium]